MAFSTLIKARKKMPKEMAHAEAYRNVPSIQPGITLGKNSSFWAAQENVPKQRPVFCIDPRNSFSCASEIFYRMKLLD